MFNNALSVTVIGVIVVVALVTIIVNIVKAKKANPNDSIPEILAKISDVVNAQVVTAFAKALELKDAQADGFDGVKNFVLDQIQQIVADSTQLTAGEKGLLNRAILEEFVTPVLKQLWDKKLQEQQAAPAPTPEPTPVVDPQPEPAPAPEEPKEEQAPAVEPTPVAPPSMVQPQQPEQK
jgi:outer membrane biosynthesis protein TonB